MNEEAVKLLANMGVDVKEFQTNANEVMNTGAANLGQELVPDEVFVNEIFESFMDYGTFIGGLTGNHGTNMDKTMKVPVLGDVGFFTAGSEKTTGAFALAQGVTELATDEIQIDQKKYYMTIDISDELSKFNVMGADKFAATLKEKVGKAMARTVEAAIINGDTETGATGNVNLDDAAPTAGTYYLHGTGLRRTAIAGSLTTSVGTFDEADLLTIMGGVGDFASDPTQCMWLFNRSTYNKALGIATFAEAYKNGKGSTIVDKALTNILGSDLFVPRDMLKTEADGKSSTTAGNNTLGQLMYVWKPAIQFGFSGTLNMRVFDMGKDGYQLQAWFYFGYAIANELASQSDPSLWAGINVTV